MLISFFRHIGSFLQNENDLSDITCAMCYSSDKFKEWFIRFFFPCIDVTKISSIEREVPDEKGKHSRVDLLIRLADDPFPYLIEVKIYDRQHHFGQYEEAYGIERDHLGYITNYVCHEGKKLGYDVKTWNEWYSVLNTHVRAMSDSEEKSLCSGYLVYLKQVCGFTNLVKSLSTNQEVLTELMKTMKAALIGCYEKVELHITSTITADCVYTFQYKSHKGVLRGAWLGLLDKESAPKICIGFQSNLAKAKPIYSWLKQNGLASSDIWEENMSIYKYSGKCQVIPLSSNGHETFIKCTRSEDQVSVIKDYIQKVLLHIEEKLS